MAAILQNTPDLPYETAFPTHKNVVSVDVSQFDARVRQNVHDDLLRCIVNPRFAHVQRLPDNGAIQLKYSTGILIREVPEGYHNAVYAEWHNGGVSSSYTPNEGHLGQIITSAELSPRLFGPYPRDFLKLYKESGVKGDRRIRVDMVGYGAQAPAVAVPPALKTHAL